MTNGDDSSQGMFEGPLSIPDMAVIGVFILSIALLSLYFLVAMFVPKMRPRWGIRRIWARGTDMNDSETILAPKFGRVTCLGMSMFIGALLIPMIRPSWGFKVPFGIFVTGWILIFIGGIIDSDWGRKGYWRE